MDGGLEPAWAKGVNEIFYRTTRSPYLGTTLMTARVETSKGFRAETPRRLLEGPYDIVPVFGQSYDVAADGRFLMLKFAPNRPPSAIDLVLGAFADVRRSTEIR
jgi:hypothetical protein